MPEGWARSTGAGIAVEFTEALKNGLPLLWANKLRSVLTLLRVVSVIAVVTLLNGASTYVATKFSSYGEDVFTVAKMPQIITNSEDYERFQKRKDILFPGYLYVAANCKHCVGIVAQQVTVGKHECATDTARSEFC